MAGGNLRMELMRSMEVTGMGGMIWNRLRRQSQLQLLQTFKQLKGGLFLNLFHIQNKVCFICLLVFWYEFRLLQVTSTISINNFQCLIESYIYGYAKPEQNALKICFCLFYAW